MKTIKLLYLVLLITFACSDDSDDLKNLNFNNQTDKIQLSEEEEITQESELFDYLKKVATDDETPNENITCIDFNYPLSIFVFDEANEFHLLSAVLNNVELSFLLENIEPEHSISISFPISATLETGEEFEINNKQELKTSIDNCLEEELIHDFNGLLQNCSFKVGLSSNYDNSYLGTIFKESNGFTELNFFDETETVIGSWTALLIEQEPHININLINTTEEISDFFNYNWKVEYLDSNSLKLTNEDRELILNQRCDENLGICTNFHYEVCEDEVDSEVSSFIFDDYVFCILDTLELNENSVVSFHEIIEDAENTINSLPTDQAYNNTENNQSIFVKIIDEDNSSDYIIEIILISTSC